MVEYRNQYDGDDGPGQQLLGKVVQINILNGSIRASF
jgi:hypothetical protein